MCAIGIVGSSRPYVRAILKLRRRRIIRNARLTHDEEYSIMSPTIKNDLYKICFIKTIEKKKTNNKNKTKFKVKVEFKHLCMDRSIVSIHI